MGQLLVLAEKWFPGRAHDAACLGEALWLEGDYWEKMGVAVAQGIAKAFGK